MEENRSYLEQVKAIVMQYKNENDVIPTSEMVNFRYELNIITQRAITSMTDETRMGIAKDFMAVYNYLDDFLVKFFDNTNEEINNILYIVIEALLMKADKAMISYLYAEMKKLACKEKSGFGSYIVTSMQLWFVPQSEVAKDLLDLVKRGELTNKVSITELAESFLVSKDMTSFLVLVEYYDVDIGVIEKYLIGPGNNGYPEQDLEILDLIIANYAGCPEVYKEKWREAKRHNQDLATYLN